jgi:hypothetical protein
LPQTVLVLDFFKHSPLKASTWRLLHLFGREKALLDADPHKYPAPDFEPQKHILLCSELKQLYVLVTRARERLLMYDSCRESQAPLLSLLLQLRLAEVGTKLLLVDVLTPVNCLARVRPSVASQNP